MSTDQPSDDIVVHDAEDSLTTTTVPVSTASNQLLSYTDSVSASQVSKTQDISNVGSNDQVSIPASASWAAWPRATPSMSHEHRSGDASSALIPSLASVRLAGSSSNVVPAASASSRVRESACGKNRSSQRRSQEEEFLANKNRLMVDVAIRAMREQQWDVVETLAKDHPDLIATRGNEGSDSPLHLAATNTAYLPALKILLKSARIRHHVNSFNSCGSTPLHSAIFGNNLLALTLLCASKGIDVNRRGQVAHGYTPLHLAVVMERLELVGALLDCSRELSMNERTLIHTNASGETVGGSTPMHFAVEKQRVEIVARLARDPRLNLTLWDYSGQNPLHAAIALGHRKIVELLLTARRSPEMSDPELTMTKEGMTVLHLACKSNQWDICKMFLDRRKLDVNAMMRPTQETLLHLAVIYRNPVFVSALLDDPAIDVSPLTAEHLTPLHYASQHVLNDINAGKLTISPEALAALLQCKPNTTLNDLLRICPILPDCEGSFAILLYLLQKKAPTNVADSQGRCALMPFGKLPQAREMGKVFKHFLAMSKGELCAFCASEFVAIRFQPCGHEVFCKKCAAQSGNPNCGACGARIDRRIELPSGAELDVELLRAMEASVKEQEIVRLAKQEETKRRLAHMGTKDEIVERLYCAVCLDEVFNMAFECGHVVCAGCLPKLTKCHSCYGPVSAETSRRLFF